MNDTAKSAFIGRSLTRREDRRPNGDHNDNATPCDERPSPASARQWYHEGEGKGDG